MCVTVRYVVAPEDRAFPDFVRPVQSFGRHRLYEVTTTGYFDLVGSDLTFTGDKRDFFPAAASWLRSDLPRLKEHPAVELGGRREPAGNVIPLARAAEALARSSSPLAD